jgi:hypothetical protein
MVTPSCSRMSSCLMCAHPALYRIKTSETVDDRISFRPRRMHQRDRGYLHSEIAANAVQGSSTVTVRMKEREAHGASYDSGRPDIPRQDILTLGSGRPIAPTHRMNVRLWFGSASWLAPSSPS